jgi:hypothetical protein
MNLIFDNKEIECENLKNYNNILLQYRYYLIQNRSRTT